MSKIDLKTHSIYKLYFRYFLPSLCAMLALSSYNVIDGIFVGQHIGEAALAAVGIAWPVFPVLIAYELLFSIGAASIASYHLGHGAAHEARVVFSSVFYFALISGVFIGLFLYTFCDEIVVLLGASEAIAPLATQFLEVIFLGSVIIVLHPLLDIFVMNDKRPVLAMVAMIVGAVSNVILNYTFIFILELGLTGSALATICGHGIGFLILLTHFVRKKGEIFFVLAFKFRALVKSAQNGIAQAFAELSASIVMLVANHLLVALGGDRAVAMYSVIMYSGIMLFTALLSASGAVQPIASFNYGAAAYERLLKVLKFALCFALALGAALYAASWVFSQNLVIMFLQRDSGGAVDEAFLSDVISAMRIYFLGYFFVGFNMVVASFFQSIQRPLSSFIVTISYTLVFVLILFLILPKFYGLNGMWMSYPSAEFLSFFVAILVLFYELKFGVLRREKI